MIIFCNSVDIKTIKVLEENIKLYFIIFGGKDIPKQNQSSKYQRKTLTTLTTYKLKPASGKKRCKFLRQMSSEGGHYLQHMTHELIFLYM